MDRYDEARDRRTDDVVENDDTKRSGDVLGLGGAAVPKMPGDPSTANDADSVAQRRERALGDDEPTRTEDPDRQRSGATGIDMGAGGEGTHLSGK
jgi:hypothetical protein